MAIEDGLVDEPSGGAPITRRRSARRFSVFLLLLIALAAGGIYTATAVVVHVDNVVLPGVDVPVPRTLANLLPHLDPSPAPGSPGTKRINILVLGVDRRPHHDPKVDGPPNADSIHIISLDPVTKTASALALPRDLYVEVPSPERKPDFWEIRINTAFKLGEEYKYPGGGPAFAKRAVEYNFHIPIDYYAVVDWVAFADVIEAMGGVWINVPEVMKNVEGFNPHDGNSFKITIAPGWQYMDAITALAYARFRDDDENDFGRIRRQQEVMRSAADEALRHGWLAQAPKLYDRFRGAVNTDFSAARLPGVVVLAKTIGVENIKTVSLAGENREAVKPVITPWGEDVLVPHWDVMGKIVRGSIDDRTLTSEGATVMVVNATGQRGQDERVAAYLRRFLLPPEWITVSGTVPTGTATATGVRAGNAALPPASLTTSITYTGDAAHTANRVAEWLGLPQGRVAQSDSFVGAPAAVTVTLGTDVRIPDDERFLRYRTR